MGTPKISVIIPVYNVEEYLSRCIDSVLSSVEQDLEILLIDDGSKDRSGSICDEYAERDARIRVFHKANGGVGSARNLGIDHATGEWLAFVDSDDEVSPDFLSIPTGYNDCDAVQKGFVSVQLNGYTETAIQQNDIISGQDDICRFFIQHRTVALWNKLIKRSVVGDSRFCDNIPIGEDGIFFFSIINKIGKWGFSDCGHYIYYVRKGSAMYSYKITQRLGIRLRSCWETLNIANNNGTKMLFDNYFADQFLPPLWRRRGYFSEEQKREYKQLLAIVKWYNLRYLSKRHFVKYVIIALRSKAM